MITYIKKNPIKIILMGFLTITLGLNYFGFCYHQMRFLSDEEKIRIVVEEVLYLHPNIGVFVEQPNINNGRKEWEVEQETLNLIRKASIPYRDIDEFFSLNPKCCQVSTDRWIEGGFDHVGFSDRLIGSISTFIKVKYRVRYRDGEGVIQSKLMETAPAITSCGHIWDGF